ncbi:MAG: TetR/AcrR family transcriptional regulator [Proteobacteria bacterium]|nr:TetR/AcrR family transcriptional regulator [Pseudomonadota bacterium]
MNDVQEVDVPQRRRRAPATARRHRYHHGDLKAALVAVATEALERDGQAALSLRGVARGAGVSQAAPYHHFSDKEALLAGVAGGGFDRLSAALDALDDSGPPGDVLHAACATAVRFALAHPELFRLMVGASIPHRDAYPALETARAGVEDRLRATVGALLGEGANPQELAVATAGTWSLVTGLARSLIDRTVPAGRGHLPREAAVLEQVLAVYVRGLATPPPPRAIATRGGTG